MTLDVVVGKIHDRFVKMGWTLSVAESCTGGALASALVKRAGASQFFSGGIVSYSNAVKANVLGVNTGTLKGHGAVSYPVAEQMAKQVRDKMETTWSLSTTGIAGPDGGSDSKPVGTLCVGIAGPGFVGRTMRQSDVADRESFIEDTVHWSLTHLLETVEEGTF